MFKIKALSPFLLGLALLALPACKDGQVKPGQASLISQAPYGQLADGRQVSLYTLKNKGGAQIKITNYGGIVTSIEVPDRSGKLGDVVLGYDSLDGYIKETPYFGCIVGRYANRIKGGSFTLEGKTYNLAKNNGANALHGGVTGFDKVLWKAEPKDSDYGPALLLTYSSSDGEEGYPGQLTIKALHTWTSDNTLLIEFSAKTDKSTVLNLTHHSYFNLAGNGSGDILGHEMQILSDTFTPVDETLIPTGELKPVKDTPFDFNDPVGIGKRIADKDQQLERGKGYDHNWVLRKKKEGQLDLAARVRDPKSGRILEVSTTDPGLQFYSGNFLDGKITGKGGAVYQLRNGFCLEPQHYPNSPNQASFPSTVLKPGETYRHTLSYHFTVE